VSRAARPAHLICGRRVCAVPSAADGRLPLSVPVVRLRLRITGAWPPLRTGPELVVALGFTSGLWGPRCGLLVIGRVGGGLPQPDAVWFLAVLVPDDDLVDGAEVGADAGERAQLVY